MGSSASKASNAVSKLPAAATKTARKYPTRTPPTTSTNTTTNARPHRPTPEASIGPTVHPETHMSEMRDQAINLDASDPDLALNARLRTLGPVQPNPTQSNSSTFSFQPQNSGIQSNAPQSSSSDPSSASSQFQPSASNPQQSIFPTAHSGSAQRPNAAVSLLTARYRLAEEAEMEFARTGKSSAVGRRFVDVHTLKQILLLRDVKGLEGGEIERKLGLGEGSVRKLGAKGVVGVGS
ncbi:hypothetical protein LZ554_004046 [Drepanopeziza brunnea f. sp. 'monogermtubi']|nr:hypothetical protein LZ554_004046 [Drepanopeziza brunnea f. sp. 'monogermtubi']